jgi:hypothetical protein
MSDYSHPGAVMMRQGKRGKKGKRGAEGGRGEGVHLNKEKRTKFRRVKT